MTAHFLASFLLLAASAFAGWVAYRKGFFRAPKEALEGGISFLTLFLLFALYFGLQLGLGFGIGSLYRPTSPQVVGYLQMGIVGLTTLALIAYKGRFFLKGPLFPHVAIGACAFLLVFPLSGGLGQLVEGFLTIFVEHKEKEQTAVAVLRQAREFPLLYALSSLMTIVAVPIAEEMLFRGGVQGWLRKRMGAIGAIAIASTIFALVHLTRSQGWTNLTLLASLLPLSVCLGYLYERQRSLWAPIALHGVFNGVTVIGLVAGA